MLSRTEGFIYQKYYLTTLIVWDEYRNQLLKCDLYSNKVNVFPNMKILACCQYEKQKLIELNKKYDLKISNVL